MFGCYAHISLWGSPYRGFRLCAYGSLDESLSVEGFLFSLLSTLFFFAFRHEYSIYTFRVCVLHQTPPRGVCAPGF